MPTKKDPSKKSGSEQTVVIRDDALKRFAGGFTSVPNVVLRNPDLSIGAKATYAMLLSYAWQDDFSFPAQETLARDLASGDRSVRRWLLELKHQGFINWKQRGLTRPNTYYLLKMPTREKGAPGPASEGAANLASPARPSIRTGQNGQAGPANLAVQDRPEWPTTKTQGKKTHSTHTGLGADPGDSVEADSLHGGVSSPSRTRDRAADLIQRFLNKQGRAPRDPSPKEMAFATRLIAEHGYTLADYVITYGLAAAKETNYEARFFQGLEQYVAEALEDFARHQAGEERKRLAAKQREAERRKALREAGDFYAQPIDQRVDRALESWVATMRTLKRRELTREEIGEKRATLYEYQSRGEAEWRTEYQKHFA